LSKIKIGFDAKRLFLNHSGLGNYSRNLVRNLHTYFPDNEYILFTPESDIRLPEFSSKPYKIIQPTSLFDKLLKSNWRSRTIIKQIINEEIDAYHGLSNELPFSIAKFKGRKIVTIHDVIFMRHPEFYSAFDCANYKKKVISACQNADTVIAISKQTKFDLIQYLKIDESKIKVIYQSCEDVFWNVDTSADNSIIKENNLPNEYLLYVGTVEPRKNLLKLVEALKNIDIPLVVVGRIKSAYGKQIMNFIAENRLSNKVFFLKNVSNARLASLYKNAVSLVYPSEFEGFGLPVLEAMVCGCPVITGNNSSLTEVGGSAAIYIDVNKHSDYVEKLNYVIQSKDVRSDLISKGLRQKQQFTPKLWAQNTVEFYNS
jgi:glycosyltransferase involved in cell wall biosynthesis